jgi:hypothetical protein
MKKLFWCATGILAWGFLAQSKELKGIGGTLGFAWFIWLILRGIKNMALSGRQLAVNKYRDNQAEKREEKEYQKQLRRELERERLKAEMQLEIYRKQVDLMVEYKKRGADITKELFDMRKHLLELESAENKNMVQEILNTLDGL